MSQRVAIYARVSTLHNQNPEMQLAELREYASRRGWEVTAEYVDLGVSGSRESRPELNRMLAAAHARAFDAVVCWKLDRLGRSLKHLVTTIEDLSAYGVAFISLRDNLDLSTPSGRLMLHIIGAMAQFERELIKERVSAGMHAARKRGSRIGRPRAYANADKIRALRAQDVPWRAIAKQLGIGTGTAIRAIQKWRYSVNEIQLAELPFPGAGSSCGSNNIKIHQTEHAQELQRLASSSWLQLWVNSSQRHPYRAYPRLSGQTRQESLGPTCSMASSASCRWC